MSRGERQRERENDQEKESECAIDVQERESKREKVVAHVLVVRPRRTPFCYILSPFFLVHLEKRLVYKLKYRTTGLF